jgi:hypothetical protein
MHGREALLGKVQKYVFNFHILLQVTVVLWIIIGRTCDTETEALESLQDQRALTALLAASSEHLSSSYFFHLRPSKLAHMCGISPFYATVTPWRNALNDLR